MGGGRDPEAGLSPTVRTVAAFLAAGAGWTAPPIGGVTAAPSNMIILLVGPGALPPVGGTAFPTDADQVGEQLVLTQP